MPNACFVTISEPLGTVPMQSWSGSFPMYDDPVLFRDDAQRSSMTKQQWEESPLRTDMDQVGSGTTLAR